PKPVAPVAAKPAALQPKPAKPAKDPWGVDDSAAGVRINVGGGSADLKKSPPKASPKPSAAKPSPAPKQIKEFPKPSKLQRQPTIAIFAAPPAPPRRRRKRWPLAVALTSLLLVGGGGYVAWQQGWIELPES